MINEKGCHAFLCVTEKERKRERELTTGETERENE